MTGILLPGVILAIACSCGAFMLLWDDGHVRRLLSRRRSLSLIEREKDLAAGLGWPLRRWLALRAALTAAGIALGVLSHVFLLIVAGGVAGFLGFRFAISGRSLSRRLAMERAFLAQLRNIRDRMAISQQSLDTALQEVGRNPGPECAFVLAPLGRGGSVIDNIVECGIRSRSPLIEHACGVLIWARSRSLDAIIDAVDQVILPVGEAQLAVREEAAVTLAQQRAVSTAMGVLLVVMFAAVMRVEAFRAYYATVAGNLVLGLILVLFALLVILLGMIVRVDAWSRWDLKRLAAEQGRFGG